MNPIYQRIAASLFCALSLGTAARAAADWTLFETAQGTDHKLREVTYSPAGPLSGAVAVDPAQRFQTIEGFGGALTESAGWVLAQLPRDKRDEVVRRYYDPKIGIGYTLARTQINSCDFSLGCWALDPVAGDTTLSHFSLAPMRAWVLPLIHDAIEAGGRKHFHLLASPWSPPSWMKTNGQMTHGGKLKPEDREVWAEYLAKFIGEMKRQESIDIWALTIQNEPAATQTWESCLYTAEEERDFIRDFMGPALQRAGLNQVKLCILDHNRDLVDAWTRTIFSDPMASRYCWGTAMHWYVSDDFAAPARAHAAFPDKPTIMTEACCDSEPEFGKFGIGNWEHAERYAHSFVNDFNNWVSGWIDWNIALDQAGGPNHVGNFCDAPVIVNTETGQVTYEPSYYYIGQFSKFVHPGARRIGISVTAAPLEAVAFANPSGELAVVVLNRSNRPVDFSLSAAGASRPAHIPAHAIQTYLKG
jgi:glucosylceramidase